MCMVTPPETTETHRRRLRMILVGMSVTVILMVAAVLLIEHGWRLRVNSNGIEIAAIHYPDDIPIHIAHGVDINAPPWPLQFAVNFQNPESVRVLLANGADPNLPPGPLLDLAAMHLDEPHGREIVMLLLENGADVNARATFGYTALSVVVQHSDELIARELIDRGADPDATGDAGQAPLSWAAAVKDEPMVRLLLELGASPHIRDKQGHSAYSGATSKIKAIFDEHAKSMAGS